MSMIVANLGRAKRIDIPTNGFTCSGPEGVCRPNNAKARNKAIYLQRIFGLRPTGIIDMGMVQAIRDLGDKSAALGIDNPGLSTALHPLYIAVYLDGMTSLVHQTLSALSVAPDGSQMATLEGSLGRCGCGGGCGRGCGCGFNGALSGVLGGPSPAALARAAVVSRHLVKQIQIGLSATGIPGTKIYPDGALNPKTVQALNLYMRLTGRPLLKLAEIRKMLPSLAEELDVQHNFAFEP